MNKALYRIRMDTSLPMALARSILEALVIDYFCMRNRRSVYRPRVSMGQHKRAPGIQLSIR